MLIVSLTTSWGADKTADDDFISSVAELTRRKNRQSAAKQAKISSKEADGDLTHRSTRPKANREGATLPESSSISGRTTPYQYPPRTNGRSLLDVSK